MAKFPDTFIFGASTSAYQIEGAWDKDGKGENIWDRLIHTHPELVRDGTNADIACDSYHKYKEDVELIKTIGFAGYKFSISWCRILPQGVATTNNINQAGINYYNNVINELISNNVQPMVCLYHSDLPQKLQDIGGWCNPLMIDYFADYARIVFENFGDRVKWWVTINEPNEVVHGYVERRHAPYLSLECFDADYIAYHTMLKAHARVYRIYEKEFKPQQQGKVSIILKAWFFKGKTESSEDEEAAFKAQQFTLGICAHPIFSETGDYPPIVRKLVDENSKKEGKIRSKLPRFTEEEINEIKGSYDYMAINHYTSALARDSKMVNARVSWEFRDADVVTEFDKSWPSTAHWSKVVPWGLREVLRWIKREYNNPPVYITENGYCDHGDINDLSRIKFHKDYLKELLKAMYEHDCNVIGYNVWSLLDNFEWLAGLSYKYGIVHVNHDSPNKERNLKSSASFFQELCETRCIPQDY